MSEPSQRAKDTAKKIATTLQDPCAGDESAPCWELLIQSALDAERADALREVAEQIRQSPARFPFNNTLKMIADAINVEAEKVGKE